MNWRGDGSQSGADRKSTPSWFVSKYLFIEVSGRFFCDSTDGFLSPSILGGRRINQHLMLCSCPPGFVVKELEMRQALFLPSRSLQSNRARETTQNKPRIHIWVLEAKLLASAFLCGSSSFNYVKEYIYLFVEKKFWISNKGNWI